ncbi:PorV/PorQ family protein [Rhabdobacter roseus]
MLVRKVPFALVLGALLAGRLPVVASADVFPIGARAWSLANAVVAQSNRYAIFNNVAGLAGVDEPSLFSSYHSHYGFEGLHTLAFGAVVPLHEGLTGGFSVQRFGDELYNDLALGVGVGHRINWVSLGIKINYVQVAANAASLAISRKAVAVELGGIARLNAQLTLGAHLYNVTQSTYSGETTARLPTLLKTGLTYEPSQVLRLSAELYKDTDYPLSLRTGLEYEVVSNVFLRTGIATKPHTNHFGAGFLARQFAIDYALHTHSQLGWSHHFTLGYALEKSKKKALE